MDLGELDLTSVDDDILDVSEAAGTKSLGVVVMRTIEHSVSHLKEPVKSDAYFLKHKLVSFLVHKHIAAFR